MEQYEKLNQLSDDDVFRVISEAFIKPAPVQNPQVPETTPKQQIAQTQIPPPYQPRSIEQHQTIGNQQQDQTTSQVNESLQDSKTRLPNQLFSTNQTASTSIPHNLPPFGSSTSLSQNSVTQAQPQAKQIPKRIPGMFDLPVDTHVKKKKVVETTIKNHNHKKKIIMAGIVGGLVLSASIIFVATRNESPEPVQQKQDTTTTTAS